MLMHQSRCAPVRAVGTALVIAAASLLASIASANEDGQFSAVVKYSDLDLSKTSDVQTLYSRLKEASEQVCYTYRDRTLRMQQMLASCSHAALNRAVERVAEPKLTQLHAAEPRIRVARRG